MLPDENGKPCTAVTACLKSLYDLRSLRFRAYCKTITAPNLQQFTYAYTRSSIKNTSEPYYCSCLSAIQDIFVLSQAKYTFRNK